MGGHLPAGPLPPGVLLLTHAWFGAEAGELTPSEAEITEQCVQGWLLRRKLEAT